MTLARFGLLGEPQWFQLLAEDFGRIPARRCSGHVGLSFPHAPDREVTRCATFRDGHAFGSSSQRKAPIVNDMTMSLTPTPSRTHTIDAESDSTLCGAHTSADASLPRTVTETPVSPEEDPALLEQTVLEAGAMLHSSRYRLITALAAYDRAGHWALTGAITCAHWAADSLGVAVCTAREWLRVGHALEALPTVARAMADRRLSYCAVRTLTRVAVDHPEHQDELVDLAERSRPGELGRNLAHWALGHDTEEQHDERERRETHLSMRIEPDGMGVIHARLPAIALGRIQAAIDCLVMQSTRSDPDDPRPSLGRQRALALVDLVTTGGSDAERGARVATEVIVHVRNDGVSLHDGTPLADSVIADLIDTAFIRVLIHDAENRPVNASVRRRHPTPRQKRVVDERDKRCIDCGGTELLQYDHDPEYEITQRTHTDELFLRCPRCHARRHQRASRGD